MTTNETTPPRAPDGQYDPPRVEQVLSPDELAREVHYAGVVSGSTPG